MDVEAIRRLFPALSQRIYLNCASEGPMPADAIAETERLARLKATPWEIGTEFYYSEPALVRERIETLIGARPGSVALVGGTSAGIGIAARGLPLSPGDEVLLLEAQFPSNTNPWRAAVLRGARLRVVPRPFGSDPTAALLSAMGPSTRIVSIDWVNFVDGAAADLARIGTVCRERGIRFVVDAAQGLGALSVDVTSHGIDILAAPSHKWLLGPVGCGLVYVAPDLLETLQPWNSGWVNVAARSGFRNMLQLSGDPPPDATRLETGSPPYNLLVPWKISLDLLIGSGSAAVESRVLALAARLARGVSALAPAQGGGRGLTLVTPADPAPRSGIVSFRSAGDRTLATYRSLAAQSVTVALREGAIRASTHVFNTEDEVDEFLVRCRRALD